MSKKEAITYVRTYHSAWFEIYYFSEIYNYYCILWCPNSCIFQVSQIPHEDIHEIIYFRGIGKISKSVHKNKFDVNIFSIVFFNTGQRFSISLVNIEFLTLVKNSHCIRWCKPIVKISRIIRHNGICSWLIVYGLLTYYITNLLTY